MEHTGNIVGTYHYANSTVYISDAAYASKSEEELDEIRQNARRLAVDVMVRSAGKDRT